MASLLTRVTYRFLLGATKDGAVWDLTGASVTLLFEDPDGAVAARAATLLVAADGSAYYDCPTTDLGAGRWKRAWRVVQGGTDATSEAIEFSVKEALHA